MKKRKINIIPYLIICCIYFFSEIQPLLADNCRKLNFNYHFPGRYSRNAATCDKNLFCKCTNKTALRNVKNLNSTNAKLIEDVCKAQ